MVRMTKLIIYKSEGWEGGGRIGRRGRRGTEGGGEREKKGMGCVRIRGYWRFVLDADGQ